MGGLCEHCYQIDDCATEQFNNAAGNAECASVCGSTPDPFACTDSCPDDAVTDDSTCADLQALTSGCASSCTQDMLDLICPFTITGCTCTAGGAAANTGSSSSALLAVASLVLG